LLDYSDIRFILHTAEFRDSFSHIISAPSAHQPTSPITQHLAIIVPQVRHVQVLNGWPTAFEAQRRF